MGFFFVGFLLSASATLLAAGQEECNAAHRVAPMVTNPSAWLPKSIDLTQIPQKDVISHLGIVEESCSADGSSYTLKRVVIGTMPQFRGEDAVQVVYEARKAWKRGVWTNEYSLQQRVGAIRKFLGKMKDMREELSEILQWEIAKNTKDAFAEVDRTIQFAEKVLEMVLTDSEFTGHWKTIGNLNVFVKRAALGVVLALAPYNYPLNECYAAVLPALIMGNVVHLKTFEALAETLPEGTITFISGSGRETMPPVMKTGEIDALAFIGGSGAADKLIHDHPHPHRLKPFLQLEAKNFALVLPDGWDDYEGNKEALDNQLDQIVSGSLSYNGQRCTAIKMIFLPEKYSGIIARKIKERLETLRIGLPWQTHGRDGLFSNITPLPNMSRVYYMKELIQDAVDKGAKLLSGGLIKGGEESTLLEPALVFPVKENMRLYTEEQFGPVVPVATYNDIEEILAYSQNSDTAQQVAIFGSDPAIVARLIDAWGSVYGKINWNVSPGRSPDELPFSGRKSSAIGVMSVRDAALEFSVPTVVSSTKSQSFQGVSEATFLAGSIKSTE